AAPLRRARVPRSRDRRSRGRRRYCETRDRRSRNQVGRATRRRSACRGPPPCRRSSRRRRAGRAPTCKAQYDAFVRLAVVLALSALAASARADDSKLAKEDVPLERKATFRGKNKLCCG